MCVALAKPLRHALTTRPPCQDKYAYIFDGIQRAHAPDVHSSHGLLAGPDPGLDERTGRQVMATTSHAGGAEASRWPASASELAELHASFNAATSRAYNVRRAQWTFTLFADLAQLESGAPEPGNDRIDVTNVADRVPAALGDAHRGVPWRSRLLQAHRHPAADLATAPGEEEDGGFGDELVALNSAPGTDARGDGVDSLVEGSDFGRRMRRVAAIVRWLEASARATGLPRTDRVGHWPRTTKRIRSELLHRGSVPGNGTSVDPDAPYHEHGATAAGGNDAEDDAEEEARLFRAVWQVSRTAPHTHTHPSLRADAHFPNQALRAGCPAEARGLTLRAGSLWQTAAMTSFGPTDPAFASRDAAAPVLHARGDPVWQMAVWRLGARAEEASGEPEDRAAVGRMGAYLRCAAAESLLAATLAGDTQRALRADGSAGWEHTLWLVFRAMQEQKEADVAAATETIAAPLHDPAHGPSLVHAYAHLRRKQSPHGAAVDARSLFLNEPVPGATFVAALAEGRAAAGVPDASRLGAHDPYALMQAAILCGSASRLAHVLDRISTAFAPANAGANDGALSGTGDADALSVKGNAGYLPGESPGIHPSPLLLVCAAHMALVTRQALRGGVARDSALFTDAASVGPAEEQALDRTLARCAAFFADPLCGRRPTLVPQYLAHVEDAGSRRSILATFFEVRPQRGLRTCRPSVADPPPSPVSLPMSTSSPLRQREQDMEAREACVREARQAVLGAEGPAALESRDFVHALCRALGTQRAVEHQRVEALQHGRAPEDLWGDAASGGGDGTAPLPADERVVQSVTWIAEDPDAALDAVIQANAALRTFARRAHRLTASGAGRSRPMASSLAACTMLFSQDALMDALNTLLDEIDSVAAARRTAAGGVEHRQRLCEAASEEFSSWQLLFDGQQAFRRWIQAGTDVAGVQVQTDEFYRRVRSAAACSLALLLTLHSTLRVCLSSLCRRMHLCRRRPARWRRSTRCCAAAGRGWPRWMRRPRHRTPLGDRRPEGSTQSTPRLCSAWRSAEA